jgi:hypothetical protein
MLSLLMLPLQIAALPVTLPVTLALAPVTVPLSILSFPFRHPFLTALAAGGTAGAVYMARRR